MYPDFSKVQLYSDVLRVFLIFLLKEFEGHPILIYNALAFLLFKKGEYPSFSKVNKARASPFLALHKNGILSCSLFKDLIKNQETSSDPIIREEDEKWSITYSGKMPTLKEMEDFLIAEAMKKSKEKQSIAALHLGISQSTLSRRFKKK